MNRTQSPMTLVAVLLAGLLVASVTERAGAAVEVGDTPKFQLPLLDGPTVTHEALRGKYVVLDFWATWCGPCIKAMPHMKELRAKYRSQGVELVGVSLDSNRSALQKMVKQDGLDWPHAFDGQGWKNATAQQFGVTGIPRTFLLSPEGEVLFVGHPMSGLAEAIEKAVTANPVRARSDEAVEGGEGGEAAGAAAQLNAARAAIDAAEPDFAAMYEHLAEVDPAAVTEPAARNAGRRLVMSYQAQARRHAEADAEARAAAATQAERFDALVAAIRGGGAEGGASEEASAGSGTSDAQQRRAQRKLEGAERAHEKGAYAEAWDDYQWIVEHAGGTAAATRAAAQLEAYAADATIAAAVEQQRAEAAANQALALARSYEQANKLDVAREHYQKVVDQYPTTAAATTAKERLTAMK